MPVQAAPLHDLDRAALVPTSAMSETALWRAYSGAIQGACVCGGDPIMPAGNDEAYIARAIRIHSDSTAHQQWRARMGIA